MIDQESVKQAP